MPQECVGIMCWQSRYYVWHKVMHTIIGGKLVLEGTWEPGKMVPKYLVELYLNNGSKRLVLLGSAPSRTAPQK